MSHYPPHGPPGPPPPYYGYQPPPPGPYGYIPAPVMLPMPLYPHGPPPAHPPFQPPSEPQPQPTYVTNYYYQQPPQSSQPHQPQIMPEPVRIVEEVIDWVPTTPSQAPALSHRAFVAGKEGWDGSPLWVIRAHHSGEFVPGKLAVKNRSAYIPHAGKEVPVHNIEVLCAPAHALRWLPASNGEVPVGAIPAGNTHSAEPLYIARVRHLRSTTPGKVHPSHKTCYISFGGVEIPYKSYEVLCRIVG